MFPVADVIPSRRTPFVTITLIALNTLAFLYELQFDEEDLQVFVQTFGVVPVHFSWLSALTSMFLHGGWLHFLGNMLYLWIFADNVEDRFGRLPFVLFYLACGAAAARRPGDDPALLDRADDRRQRGDCRGDGRLFRPVSVLAGHHRRLHRLLLDLIEIPAVYFLGIWFLMQFFSGIGSLGANAAEGGVAFWAHVSGFIAGAAMGVLGRLSYVREEWE